MNAEYLESDQIKKTVLQDLELEKAALVIELRNLRSTLSDTSAIQPDDNERGTQNESINFTTTKIKRMATRLENLNSLISKIDDDSFDGYCTDCDVVKVPAIRVRQYHSTVCAKCADLDERRERLFAKS